MLRRQPSSMRKRLCQNFLKKTRSSNVRCHFTPETCYKSTPTSPFKAYSASLKTKLSYITRMHSSKMRTTRFSGRLDPGGFASESMGGVCLWVEGGCLPLSPGGVYHTPSPHTFSSPPSTPPPADRQTLPCPKLRLRAVKCIADMRRQPDKDIFHFTKKSNRAMYVRKLSRKSNCCFSFTSFNL